MANDPVDVSIVLVDYVKIVKAISSQNPMLYVLPTFRVWLDNYLNEKTRKEKYRMSKEAYENMMQWAIEYENVKHIDDLTKADAYLISNGLAVKMPDFLGEGEGEEEHFKNSQCKCGHEHQPVPAPTFKCSKCDSCRLHYFKERLEKENGHKVK